MMVKVRVTPVGVTAFGTGVSSDNAAVMLMLRQCERRNQGDRRGPPGASALPSMIRRGRT